MAGRFVSRYTSAELARDINVSPQAMNTVLRGLERWVQAVPALSAGTLRQPHLTLWFDLAPEIAAVRLASARVPDKFESQPVEFFRRVAAGYAARMAADPGRFARIAADQPREAVWNDVLAALRGRGWL